MEIRTVPAYDHAEDVRRLFTEYTGMLIAGDPGIAEYLTIQNYDEEIQHLEHKYGLPYGRLYIAYCGDEPAGCIGMRKLDNENCELKRLYVRPEFRGLKLGEQLVKQIISDAGAVGYSHILLDTLPFLKPAIRLYKRLGFYETACYNDSPLDTTIYMRLDL